MSLIVKNRSNNKFIINIVVSFMLLGSIIILNCNRTKNTSDLYEWDTLNRYFRYLSKDTLYHIFGEPTLSRWIIVGGDINHGRRRGLHRFQKSFNDTLIFQELYYKRRNYNLYLWLLPDKDSVWRVVDAVKYNPRNNNIQL